VRLEAWLSDLPVTIESSCRSTEHEQNDEIHQAADDDVQG
jgi:hypothetical protein